MNIIISYCNYSYYKWLFIIFVIIKNVHNSISFLNISTISDSINNYFS